MRIRIVMTAATVLFASVSPAAGVIHPPREEAIRVAVFDDDGSLGNLLLVSILNGEPGIDAVSLSRDEVEEGGLASANCVIIRLFGPPTPTKQTMNALDAFVTGGGSIIGEWWGAGGALSGPAPSIDDPYGVPARFLHIFAGRASDGDIVMNDNPITVVADHPVVQGLPEVFSGGSGTEFFVRAVEPFDPDLLVVATYEGHGGTNPAIMVGPTAGITGTGNAVLLLFDAMDNPGDPELTTLWINSVRWACAA